MHIDQKIREPRQAEGWRYWRFSDSARFGAKSGETCWC